MKTRKRLGLVIYILHRIEKIHARLHRADEYKASFMPNYVRRDTWLEYEVVDMIQHKRENFRVHGEINPLSYDINPEYEVLIARTFSKRRERFTAMELKYYMSL